MEIRDEAGQWRSLNYGEALQAQSRLLEMGIRILMTRAAEEKDFVVKSELTGGTQARDWSVVALEDQRPVAIWKGLSYHEATEIGYQLYGKGVGCLTQQG